MTTGKVPADGVASVPTIGLLRKVAGAALVKEQLPWYARILMSISGPYLSARPTDAGPLLVIAGGRFVQRLRFLYDPDEKMAEVLMYLAGPWEQGIDRVLAVMQGAGVDIGSASHPLPEITSIGVLTSPPPPPGPLAARGDGDGA